MILLVEDKDDDRDLALPAFKQAKVQEAQFNQFPPAHAA